MITREQIASIGTGPGTNPGDKTGESASAQAIVNLTDVMKLIAMILLEIRDGKKANPVR
jgi:hypothetical protein